MQQYRKISALFFLSIFSVFMLHQILPHVHYDQEDTLAVFEQVQDHHHHDDEKGEEDHIDNFPGILLDVHAHSEHSEDFDQLTHLSEQVVKQKIFPFVALQTLLESYLYEPDPDSSSSNYHPLGFITDVYPTFHFLRGPPTLG